MKNNSPFKRPTWLMLTLIFGCLYALAGRAGDAPRIIWASDPVRPNETVVLMGGEFSDSAYIEIGPISNKSGTTPNPTAPETWALDFKFQRIDPVQRSRQSLKFILPPGFSMGAYLCHVTDGNSRSNDVVVNAPDPWWLQGDGGAGSSPGGWLRICGKSLSFDGKSTVFLKSDAGEAAIDVAGSDGYSLHAALPENLKPGKYAVFVHNGFGGEAGWRNAGTVEIKAPEKWPETIFNVMDFYGANAEKEIARTTSRFRPPVDRTEAINAALKKAQENHGGIVFFPQGQYQFQGEIHVPSQTILKGEGMGLVTLWWGTGKFALDGGNSDARDQIEAAKMPGSLISGNRFGLQEMSLYLPHAYVTGISCDDGLRMKRVRVRVDKQWMPVGERQNGMVVRVKDDFQITDCDILAKGSAITSGHNGVIARNIVRAGKCNCELSHSDNVLVEDNLFVSIDPTTYINVYEEGRNMYYARNKHESLYVHQSDYSFTFDGTGGAYLGKLASMQGAALVLAQDPVYPKWAPESNRLWVHCAVSILAGKGAGQYRFVTANKGREWTVDRPFEIVPDDSSVISIVPYRGHLLVIGNRFEDSNWVDMGYGSSFNVMCAHNSLYRVAELLNYGLVHGHQPSWFVQYLDNDIWEGDTAIVVMGKDPVPGVFEGPITRCAIHRGDHVHSDNRGSFKIGGDATDILVENCKLDHAKSTINAESDVAGVLFRENTFAGEPAGRYEGKGLAKVLVLPQISKDKPAK